jgi:aspartyl aminopeptidase
VSDPIDTTDDLCSFLDSAPSPFHAVGEVVRRLELAGFEAVDPTAEWPAGGRRHVAVDGAVVAWDAPPGDPTLPLAIIGAHTDSPNLRIKPRPDREACGFRQLTVEPYGGLLANSWLDRDLGLSGRVMVRDAIGRAESRSFRDDRAVLRVPQLAIHLDRDVNERGLVLDRSRHLTPVWGLGRARDGDFAVYLAEMVDAAPDAILSWDVMCHEVAGATILGLEGELLASGRLDNLASCHAATTAITSSIDRRSGDAVPVIALFDHEEVGSETSTGASGAFLRNVLGRMVASRGGSPDDLLRSLAASRCLSADMAHGTHPNYPERHDPEHPVLLGGGPVVKTNVNQRYATSARSAAEFLVRCEKAGVPAQTYAHRNDIPCGSTIGPLTAAGLGVDVVDVGAPMLSMHSARELMSTRDIEPTMAAFAAWLD